MKNRNIKIGLVALAVLALGLLGAATFDQLLGGATPSGSGQVACSTSTSAATWQTPEACTGLDFRLSTLGSTTSSPAKLGFGTTSATQATQLLMDSNFSGIQYANGDRMQLFSFHGIDIDGARGTNSSLPFVTGSGAGDYALTVNAGTGGLGLNVVGQTTVGILNVTSSLGSIAHSAVSAPTFTNGWVNFGSGFRAAGFWKDQFGIVHLEGLIHSGTVSTTSTGIAFTLPLGYRPSADVFCVTLSNDALGQVRVGADGTVGILPPSNNTWVSLDGITFRTN